MSHMQDVTSSSPPTASAEGFELAERNLDLAATGGPEADEAGDLADLFFLGRDSRTGKPLEPSTDPARPRADGEKEAENAAPSQADCTLKPMQLDEPKEQEQDVHDLEQERVEERSRVDNIELKRRRTCKIGWEKFKRKSLRIICEGKPGTLLNNILVAIDKAGQVRGEQGKAGGHV
ncbi:hypothetical protein GUITHDRAFT_115072 [Guillardia theta CCMP2712]|uniref:Uncharacterized protein n=1 Tax=Guillardia theta (strain CCMP2712) TaxID=905079 RepID=L1IR56_GUITC|nr:hypothetical protein GUITHDRAFT_115072 [Guillardia theta CCMP2712]EKX38743.1 hypothetical protein GUITHDRAFT_115072 [Guillardia theta CCMP2712]|eukprot:XP_005825723.1 hypothetical protein GUITHDRAFT_115072 [Guillardia theta CCMP2712]